MRAMKRTVVAIGTLALAMAGCSLVVNPNTDLLNPTGLNDDAMGGTDGTDASTGPDSVQPLPDTVVPASDGMACRSSCDDGVACTTDRCDTTNGACTHTPENSLCPMGQVCDAVMGCVVAPCATDNDCVDPNVCDGTEHCVSGHCVAGTPLNCASMNYCDGTETCNPSSGCVAGTPPSCDDADPCTADSCDPTANNGAGGCVHTPTGTCPPTNGTCASATAVALTTGASMMMQGTTVNGTNGDTSCMASGGTVWYAVTYPSVEDIEIVATPTGNGDTVVAVRASCTTDALVCNDDYSMSSRASRVWVRGETGSTASHTAYVAVSAYNAGSASTFALTFTLTTPIAAESCATAMFDVSNGGAVLAKMPRTAGTTTASCGNGGRTILPQDAYLCNPTTNGTITAEAESSAFTPTLWVPYSCTGNFGDAACDSNNPAQIQVDSQNEFGQPTVIMVGDGTAADQYTLQVIVP